jgi:hypothetical protein
VATTTNALRLMELVGLDLEGTAAVAPGVDAHRHAGE